MPNNLHMVLLVLAMAGITYTIRVLPMAFLRKKIHSRYLLSLLFYIPFAVLSAMTFPYIFYSTGNFYTALVGTLTKRSLILVAILSCVAVFITSLII